MRRPKPPKRSTVITWIVVLLLALIGTTVYVVIKLEIFAPSLSEQVAKVEQNDRTWWLGRTFEGLPITRAAPAAGNRINDLGYGACRRFGGKLDPFTSTRCGYPLWVQVRKRRYTLSFDEIPHQVDGTCARAAVQGAPVVVGANGSVLYTGELAIAVSGRPDQVGRALAALRPPRGEARFERPSPAIDTLANCSRPDHPFASLGPRIAALRRGTGLPLAWVGPWYAGGQLTSAGQAGAAAVLTYTSCGRASDLGRCLETMSISSEPLDRGTVLSTLEGATCRTFRASNAVGVAWTKDLAGETGVGVILFTDRAMVSLANDIQLEKIPLSQVEAVSRLVRPVPPARGLPAPAYPTKPLLAACAETSPVS